MTTQWLDRLTGDWTYESRGIPDLAEHRRTGAETVGRRGAWTVIEADSGARFQLAFDPEGDRVVGDFVAWDHPALWIYDGRIEGDRMTLSSRGPRMDGEPGETDYEDVWEIVSEDARTLTGRVRGDDGAWRDFMITRYQRRP